MVVVVFSFLYSPRDSVKSVEEGGEEEWAGAACLNNQVAHVTTVAVVQL